MRFEETYIGPEFLPPFQYSFILNVVLCTFFFGFIIPMLFPLCFFILLVMYVCERMMIFYSYR